MLKHYFTTNDIISVVKRRLILLSAVGASTYRLIRMLTVFGSKSIRGIVHRHSGPSKDAFLPEATTDSQARERKEREREREIRRAWPS